MNRLISLALLLTSCQLHAINWTNDISGGTTRASILAAMALASPGDTVWIQDGTYTISQCITQTSGITISGTSTNGTILLDAITDRSATYPGVFRYLSGLTNIPTRLTNLKITTDGVHTGVSSGGLLTGDLRTQLFCFDNLWFHDTKARPSLFKNNSSSNNFGGLFKYCAWTGLSGHGHFWTADPVLVGGQARGNGYYEWGHPLTFGSTNGWWYIEDCYASNNAGTAFTDGRGGMKVCVRSNIFVNVSVENHELLAPVLGPLALEIYGNQFTGSNPGGKDAVFVRAGTALITGNDIGASWPRMLDMVNYRSLSHTRSTALGSTFGLFGAAVGTNIWDDNYPGPYGLPTNITGVVTGAPVNATNQILVDTTQFWGTNDYWRGYTVINTTSGRGGLVEFSTSNSLTLYLAITPSTNDNTYFTNGNTYMLTQVRQALEMPGVGPGDLLCCGSQSVNPTPTTWPHEVITPIYYWNNTGVTTVSPDSYGKLIIAGLHYTNVAKPGWVPLVYPHPLWTAIQGGIVQNPPTIAGIANQTIQQDGHTATLAVTLGSGQTNVNNYTVTTASTLDALVPDSGTNYVFGGSGANRTLVIYPIPGQFGVTTITLVVTDETGAQGATAFTLTVTQTGATPPTITTISDVNGTVGHIAASNIFTVGDASTPPGDLTLTAASSNTNVIQVSHIQFGGTGAGRNVSLTADSDGTSTITVTVQNNAALTTSTNFLFIATGNAVAVGGGDLKSRFRTTRNQLH